jgi:hypothetical protein
MARVAIECKDAPLVCAPLGSPLVCAAEGQRPAAVTSPYNGTPYFVRGGTTLESILSLRPKEANLGLDCKVWTQCRVLPFSPGRRTGKVLCSPRRRLTHNASQVGTVPYPV